MGSKAPQPPPPKLLPCPFCGADMNNELAWVSAQEDGGGSHSLMCTACGSCGPLGSYEGIAERWNGRKQPKPRPTSPPPPKYQRGDVVVAACDIHKRRDDGSTLRLFLKGDRLRIVSVSESYSTITVRDDNEPSWRTVPVLAIEITKPPRPRKK